MKKIAVLATSTGSLDYLDINYENLRIARMKILMNDETFEDYTEITAEEFYNRLKTDNSLVPTSSMPSIGEILENIEELEAAGYEDLIIMPISSKMSSTYEVCLMAKNQYEGKINIEVIDSVNAAISEGYLTIRILELIEDNKNINEIVEYINKLKVNRKQYFMVDNLRLFVANGRLSGASGFIGSMFKIKPILEVNDEGQIVSKEKIRTTKKSLQKMVDLILEDLKNIKNFIVTYDTSDNEEGLNFVKEQIEAAHPGYKYYEAPITPVVGCHTGVGTVGIAYFNLDI